ncbi:BREX-1 system adenine-specific DNA-methyltransferase PglX [Microbacterium sp. SY138]|uniref:BREX-1 system adenine-specific DNA-methyltransferase PglX n=1 Tax=Microbacterium sp. SY138 TaxID=3149040 RepID=UPI00321C08FC
MDTKALENFAKAARRELIAAVAAQASAVLALGSVARTERAETVRRLETEIAVHGHEHVIDKVAYTWFNRLIALRFMDAKGYTASGVVSPAQGQAYGQPEILADAKRGDIDADVVTSSAMRGSILGLLDGTRRSTDAEGEAYALLLTEYCRYWHKSMPFMFEREGDYTELLVPAGLLADDGIVTRARNVLSEEVCADVEVIGWLYQFYISERKDEVFAGFKKNKKAGADEIPAATQLFTPHWIVRYLVENSIGRLWMLNRPDSRLVDRMDYYIAPVDVETDFLKLSGPEELTVIDPACGSGHILTYAFDLLYAIYEEEGYAPSDIPGLILSYNLHGTEIDARAGSLAAFALVMKARARQRNFFRNGIRPRICVVERIAFDAAELEVLFTEGGDERAEREFWSQFAHADTVGALVAPTAGLSEVLDAHLAAAEVGADLVVASVAERARRVCQQAKYLEQKYAAIVANPPYMGAKNMSGPLVAHLTFTYPDSKADLMTAFMERGLQLLLPRGVMAMINLPSWMFISSFAKLRVKLISRTFFAQLAHLGRGVFGSDFGSVAFVLVNRAGGSNERGDYRRLFDKHVQVRSSDFIRDRFLESADRRYLARQADFLAVPNAPIAYWLTPDEFHLYARGAVLREMATTVTGIQTSDNETFFRRWFEVSRDQLRDSPEDINRKWVPIEKGGEFRRWYGNREYVVDWAGDGRDIRARETWTRNKSRISGERYFFRRGVTWSRITIGRFSARLTPGDSIFDNAGSCLFADSHVSPILGLLNSRVADRYLELLAPTLNTQPGDIDRIPVVAELLQGGSVVDECVAIAKRDWDSSEMSWEFEGLDVLKVESGSLSESVSETLGAWAAVTERLRYMEEQNNREMIALYPVPEGIASEVQIADVALIRNYALSDSPAASRAIIEELISYAVGCMFGRYSLDKGGLILAKPGQTAQDYFAVVQSPSFPPDADNVIPFVDDGWFQDDIVERLRQFLRVAFGAEGLEENLRFVEESLGVKTLRDYFVTKAGKSRFYDDHVQRYKKRPIYWMFSSPKGSFNALIYLHRYTPSTVSTVLNEYLREYEAKLTVALQQAELSVVGGGSAKDQKEADRLRKVLAELRDYEHDVLYPLATQQIAIDLDDGVKANYPKFYPAVKKIAGLEAIE